MAVLFSAVYSVQAQVRAYRVNDRQVQTLISRIETRTDRFKSLLGRSLDRSTLNGTSAEDSVNSYVGDFESATDNLKNRFNSKQSASADVQEVLNRAAYIDAFMRQNRLNATVQRQWLLVRNDLNLLANYYNVSWRWTGVMPTNTAVVTGGSYISTNPSLTALLTRIEQRTDVYKRAMNRALDRSNVNNTQTEDNLMRYVTEFENSTDRLRQNYDARKSVSADAQEVLYRAQVIDGFMRDNNLTNRAENQWNLLRNDLNTLATYYRVSWDWTRMNSNPYWGRNNTTSTVPYRVPDSSVSTLLRRIETNTDAYKSDLSASLDRSVLNGTRSEDQINAYVSDFEKATDNLRSRFDDRRSVSTDVEEVLNRAYFIDTFMRDYRLSSNVESRWNAIRNDLNTLSNYYSVSWNWVRPNVPVNRLDAQMTGTYRLNTMQSDNVTDIVNRALSSFYANEQQRDRLRQNLERRLASPEYLVIDRRGNQVTLASSNSPQVSFDADGTVRTEQTANGRTVKISANSTYDGVNLNYEGDRMNDYYVNFMPLNNGQLRVIRRIYLENRNETVAVASVYDKIEQTANFSRVYNSNTAQNYPNGNYPNTTVNNDFVVPNGTQLVARLNNPISTKTANEGDRFTMTVSSPYQYDGAVIEGHLSDTQQSGRVTGRAQVTFNFDTIRLRNGQTYRFAGLIDQVRQPNGDTVSINNEGAVRDGSQTTRTVTRAGIGAALGAIIGAIAGGGQGAAIGAAIGAGAGAGTVVLQGRDNIDLETGANFSITSSAPSNLR